MIARHEEQGHECYLLSFHCLDLSQGRLLCRIALNSGYMVVAVTIGTQHIVELTVECRCRTLRSMTDKEHMFPLLAISRMAIH